MGCCIEQACKLVTHLPCTDALNALRACSSLSLTYTQELQRICARQLRFRLPHIGIQLTAILLSSALCAAAKCVHHTNKFLLTRTTGKVAGMLHSAIRATRQGSKGRSSLGVYRHEPLLLLKSLGSCKQCAIGMCNRRCLWHTA